MVVTSVCWFFLAVLISVFNLQLASSVKMTYGLVYRPAGLYSGSSTPSVVTSSSTTEKTKLEANETVISEQTEYPPYKANASSVTVIKASSSNTTSKGANGEKFSESDILPWLMQSAANPPFKSASSKTPHQYQVTEDSEADAANHKKHKHGSDTDHEKDSKHKKKHASGGQSHYHKEEKKEGKEGKENDVKHYAKKGGKKGENHEKKNKEDEFKKFKKNKKVNEYKTDKKQGKKSSKKGYEDKYKFNKEDKVDKFWHSHHEKGVFRKFGRKKVKDHDAEEGKKKKKKVKRGKKLNKSKKEMKNSKKEAHKEDSGHKSEKGSKHSYHHESEYGKKKQSKSNKKKQGN